mmetsp:Transcript_24250/g.29409  ORF Transcript_24250/g.29409 Transcript_24250/m.29409 type:complete len:457 (+) Transcript_24250:181-1551(+)
MAEGYGMVQFWDDAWAGNHEIMASQIPLVPHYLACFNKRQPKCNHATMLHVAAQCGHAKVVALMVDNGADVNIQDDDGKTPLFVACSFNNVDVVQILLKVPGINLELGNNEGSRPLQFAAEAGYIKVVRMLLDAGADIDAKGLNHQTALHEAVIGGHESIVRMLLSKGCDVELRDYKHKYTPLHRAIVHGHQIILKLLLGSGANMEVRDGGGMTPLHIACAGSHSSALVPLMLKAGADPNSLTKDHRTALDVGIHSGITQSTKQKLEEYGGKLKNLEIIRNVILNPVKDSMNVSQRLSGVKRKLPGSDSEEDEHEGFDDPEMYSMDYGLNGGMRNELGDRLDGLDEDDIEDDDGDDFVDDMIGHNSVNGHHNHHHQHLLHHHQDTPSEVIVKVKVMKPSEVSKVHEGVSGGGGPSLIKNRGPDFVCCQKSSACSNQNGHRGRCNANLLATSTTPVL